MKNLISLVGFLLLMVSCNTHQEYDTRTKLLMDNNWQMREAGSDEWMPASVPGTVHTDLLANGVIEDPFFRLNERDQQWIDKTDWEYRCVFTLPEHLMEKEHIRITFHGLDTYAGVFVNGQHLLTADNMFRTWQADLKPFLTAGENTMDILLESPVNKGIEKLDALGYQLPADNDQSEAGGLEDKKVSIFTRKAGYHFGWDWGPRLVTSGIWRNIAIEGYNKAVIEDIQIHQKVLGKSSAEMEAVVEISSDEEQPVILNLDTEGYELLSEKIELKTGVHFYPVKFNIPNPQLWWPNGLGDQKLYPLHFSLVSGDLLVDEKTINTGLREIRLVRDPDADGQGESFYFEVNGRPVFARGANYIPNDVFLPRVSPEKYEHILRSAAEANMNMLRVWGGGIYENDIFYDLCDQYGIMVWQDFMFACAMYPGDDAFLDNVRNEAIDNVKRLRNHACLALWCGNNEIEAAWGPYDEERGWGWKQRHTPGEQEEIWHAYDTLFHHILPEVVKQFDPATDYWHSSPSAGMGKLAGYDTRSGDMHYWGVWHGQHPFSDFKVYQSRFMSEYGFQSFPEFATVKKYTLPEDWDIESEVMAAHQRSGIGNLRIRQYMEDHYRVPEDFEHLLYVGQLLQAEGISLAIRAHRSNMPYCMGTLYWQLNDVWPVASWSGIDYFGQWKALHYFVKEAYKNTVVFIDQNDGNVQIRIVSDLMNNTAGNLHLRLLDFEGNRLWEKQMAVDIPDNNSSVVFALPAGDFLAKGDKSNLVLVVSLEKDGLPIDRAIHYFTEPKNLNPGDVNIHREIAEDDGRIIITLKADKLARNLMLINEQAEGRFSDNYFDLLPGGEVEVEIRAGLSVKEFTKGFRILHLGQTMK